MKKILTFITFFISTVTFAQSASYDLQYKPACEKHVLAIERTENGKQVTESPANYYWVESFVNEQIKKGWKVLFDMRFSETESDGFIILTNGKKTVAMFNNDGKAWIVNGCQELASETDYTKVFYPAWFGLKALTLEQIKQKLTAKEVVLLYKESLQKIFS